MARKKRNRSAGHGKTPAHLDLQEAMRLAMDWHRQGRIEQSKELYEKIIAQEPGYPEAQHMLGLALFQMGDLEAGRQCLALCLEFEPGNLTAMGNLASVLAALEKREEAAELLRQLLEMAPDRATAWRGLGDVLASLKRLPEAAQAYEQALRFWPPEQDKGSLPHNYATTLAGLGRHEQAAAMLKEILREQPGHLAAHCNLGQSLRELGQYDDACKAFICALDLEPGMHQAHLGLAGCYEAIGELEEALQHAGRARELDPCESTWFREGHLLQELGDYAKACHCYEHVLACNPACVVALNNMGVLAMNEGDAHNATIWFSRARDCDPKYDEAWTNWANLLEKNGELDKAEMAARRGAELKESPSSLVRLGYVLQRQGHIEEALAIYKRVLEMDPSDSKGVTLYLAGLGLREMPARASDSHVRGLFDHYAGFFEKHLKTKLEYRGPEVMLATLSPWLQEAEARDGASQASQNLDILDLGCGTGLCGAVLSPFARRLDGVDLSPRMLAKARQRGIYNELREAELTQSLEESTRDYHCVVAGDVFVYLGDLAQVFAAVHERLRPGGLFAFTLETHEGEGVVVGSGNRYQHGQGYLENLALEKGFLVLTLEPVVMRLEAGEPVPSLAVLLRKPL